MAVLRSELPAHIPVTPKHGSASPPACACSAAELAVTNGPRSRRCIEESSLVQCGACNLVVGCHLQADAGDSSSPSSLRRARGHDAPYTSGACTPACMRRRCGSRSATRCAYASRQRGAIPRVPCYIRTRRDDGRSLSFFLFGLSTLPVRPF